MGRLCLVPRPGVPGSRGTPSPGGLSPAPAQTPVLRGQWRTQSVNRPATQELKKSPALPQQERASRRPALLCPSARPSITLERGHPCSQLQSKPRPRAHLLTGQGGGPACGEAGTGRLDGAAGVAPGLVGGGQAGGRQQRAVPSPGGGWSQAPLGRCWKSPLWQREGGWDQSEQGTWVWGHTSH